MSVRVTHKLNESAIKALLTGPGGAVYKDMLKRCIRVESAAKRNLSSGPKRVNTGRLRSSVTHDISVIGGHIVGRVGTNVDYALYVHEGTGLFGPKHQLIRPKSAKVLRFNAKGKGKKGVVFAKYVRGMEKNPFLKNALPAFRN